MRKKASKVNKPDSLKESSFNPKKISKKDFKDNPAVEKFYRAIQQYDLREEAYKAAIEIYLDLKK